MQRAAVSIPSNIALCHARDSTPEFLRFLAIALGSLAELETQLIVAEQLTYVEHPTLQGMLSKTDAHSEDVERTSRSRSEQNSNSTPYSTTKSSLVSQEKRAKL